MIDHWCQLYGDNAALGRAVSAQAGGKAIGVVSRKSPRKISGNNRALERETMSVDNFFMKFCSKGKH